MDLEAFSFDRPHLFFFPPVFFSQNLVFQESFLLLLLLLFLDSWIAVVVVAMSCLLFYYHEKVGPRPVFFFPQFMNDPTCESNVFLQLSFLFFCFSGCTISRRFFLEQWFMTNKDFAGSGTNKLVDNCVQEVGGALVLGGGENLEEEGRQWTKTKSTRLLFVSVLRVEVIVVHLQSFFFFLSFLFRWQIRFLEETTTKMMRKRMSKYLH